MEDGRQDGLETYYAPAQKAGQVAIDKDFGLLQSDLYFQMFTEAMPDIAMVVNEERQVVYSNQALLEIIGEDKLEGIIGDRPGELFKCVNLKAGAFSCGTTRSCRYCGVVNSIIDAFSTGKSSVYECRLTSAEINNGQSFDVEVKSTPIQVSSRKFVIMSVKDISDKKRRQVLEKLFFHDILNTASGLSGILQAIDDASVSDDVKSMVGFAKKAGGELIDEIMAQRVLVSAENSDLELNVSRCSSLQILQDVAAYLSYHEIAEEKKLFIDPFSHMSQLETDAMLLKRVLINMVKNALEACPGGEVVQMGTRFSDKNMIFWVNNPGVIPDAVRAQIFQRSFSTKGANRGIGTYSIKLLVERYLGGTVSFESNKEKGTTFNASIPLFVGNKN